MIFTVEQLTIEVDDGKDDIKTLKRRHQANIKVTYAVFKISVLHEESSHSFIFLLTHSSQV